MTDATDDDDVIWFYGQAIPKPPAPPKPERELSEGEKALQRAITRRGRGD